MQIRNLNYSKFTHSNVPVWQEMVRNMLIGYYCDASNHNLPAHNFGVCCAVSRSTTQSSKVKSIITDRLASHQDVSFMRAGSTYKLYL